VIVPVFALMQGVFQFLLSVIGIFLILLILVQRGRGGGLAGALGGMGGSSAFGAKAGDIFTRITIGVAAVWIITCIAAATMGPSSSGNRIGGDDPAAVEGPKLDQPAQSEEKAGEPVAKEGEPASETKPAGEPPVSENTAAGGTEKADSDSEAAPAESKPADDAQAE
jgi:preprotein translocase subunit SecG